MLAAMANTKSSNPFLRWSFWRMALGMRNMKQHWQVGDGREEALARRVVAEARRDDPADVIRVIDEFGHGESFLMNVGDEKGAILDAAISRAKPERILELGAYCGYSALRMAVAAPSARIVSVEWSPANADIARRVHAHAGMQDRITIVVGHLGDGGATVDTLESRHGFARGNLDLVFIDHDKDAYLPDLERILDRGWLHPGSVAVADNMKFPGSPAYRAYMRDNEGKRWQTVEHVAHLEYQQFFEDIVLESTLLSVDRPSPS